MDVTGLSNQQSDAATKRLELLRDLSPDSADACSAMNEALDNGYILTRMVEYTSCIDRCLNVPLSLMIRADEMIE
jgi:hypothetical protein